MVIYNKLDPEISPSPVMTDLTLTTVNEIYVFVSISQVEKLRQAGLNSSPKVMQLKNGRVELDAPLHLTPEAVLKAFNNN